MSLSQDEMQSVKRKALGGEQAAKAWNDALNALHAYAHQSGCPAGYDVVMWFRERQAAYDADLRKAIATSYNGGRATRERGS